MRAARHWSTHDYEWRDEQYAVFTASLLPWTTPPEGATLIDLATELVAVPDAFAEFLRALVFAATYDQSLVEPLGRAWPRLMEIGLAAAAAPEVDWRATEKLVEKNLIPEPTPAPWHGDIDETLAAVRTHWLSIGQVREQVERWLHHARGERACVDALIGFLKTQPATTQAELGLPWIRAIMVRANGSASTCGFLLVGWLEQLRASGAINAAVWPDYRAIVDALVLGNYAGARALQQREE